MTVEVICPNCKRPSYITALYEELPCPHCGSIFPGNTSLVEKKGKIKRPKILVVDDEINIRELLEDLLRAKGYEVSTASNGEDALKMLKCECYDLIISDVKMPVKDGVAFFKELVDVNPSMKNRVMFVTGNMDEIEGFLKGTGLRCIHKPFDIGELLDVVDEFIHRL